MRTTRRRSPLGPTAAVALALTAACGVPRPEGAQDDRGVARILSGVEDPRFARALEPRELRFPADHGPHPDFQTEWWYLTGNLEGAGGRHFGYQATFFRTALTPLPVDRSSGWAADQLYMAHFALTDTEGRVFHSFERFARAAQDLAGARAEPFRVWLEDWELAASTAPPPDEPAPGSLPPLSLRLATPQAAIDLTLTTRKPVVLHGDRGLSRKGPSPGNASYYYSFTRLETRGTISLDGLPIEVEGSSWMDREWSTSVLEPGTTGWDWLSLQLDDGSELMFFTLRRDGAAAGYESGSLVAADGSSRPLAAGELDLAATGTWTSPASAATYPSGWRLTVPSEDLTLEIQPRLANQELTETFRYWEGAVSVAGSRGGRPIAGAGYVELTGYGSGTAPRGGTHG